MEHRNNINLSLSIQLAKVNNHTGNQKNKTGVSKYYAP